MEQGGGRCRKVENGWRRLVEERGRKGGWRRVKDGRRRVEDWNRIEEEERGRVEEVGGWVKAGGGEWRKIEESAGRCRKVARFKPLKRVLWRSSKTRYSILQCSRSVERLKRRGEWVPEGGERRTRDVYTNAGLP